MSNHLKGPAKYAVFICLLTLYLPGPCLAQLDWLKKGQELLAPAAVAPAETENNASQIAAGLKEALSVGSNRVVSQLGTLDGFNADPSIHIPLPDTFKAVQSTLNSVGMSYLLDDLELKLNRAAELATPKAKDLFISAIQQMTLEDVMDIYNGPEDAATRYFQQKMSPQLAEEMKPIVDQTLTQAGAVQAYDAVMGQYKTMPFVPDVKTNLTAYVVAQGMDGIFHYLAQEEAAIRQNPAKRTTELLQKVFGMR